MQHPHSNSNSRFKHQFTAIKLHFLILTLLFNSAAVAQRVDTLTLARLDSILTKADHPIVISFWASWCAPCLHEFPWMAKAVAQHSEEGVEWILVNMDREPVKGGLAAWIKANGLPPASYYRVLKPVMLQVADRVDPKWDGGLPATLLIAPGYRKFFMRQLTERQCLQELERLMQSQKKSG